MTPVPDPASHEPTADLTQLFFGSRGQTIPQSHPGQLTDEAQQQARQFFGLEPKTDQATIKENNSQTHE